MTPSCAARPGPPRRHPWRRGGRHPTPGPDSGGPGSARVTWRRSTPRTTPRCGVEHDVQAAERAQGLVADRHQDVALGEARPRRGATVVDGPHQQPRLCRETHGAPHRERHVSRRQGHPQPLRAAGPPAGALELHEQPPQEVRERLPLEVAQRRQHPSLVVEVGRDDPLDQLPTAVGQQDEGVASVLGVGSALHEPGLRQAVHAHADRARGQPQLVHEPPLGHPGRRPQAREGREHGEARPPDAVLGEERLELGVDVRADPREARHDPDRAHIQVGARDPPLRDQPVDRVGQPGRGLVGGRGHGGIVTRRSL
jgi:hypothetical protein